MGAMTRLCTPWCCSPFTAFNGIRYVCQHLLDQAFDSSELALLRLVLSALGYLLAFQGGSSDTQRLSDVPKAPIWQVIACLQTSSQLLCVGTSCRVIISLLLASPWGPWGAVGSPLERAPGCQALVPFCCNFAVWPRENSFPSLGPEGRGQSWQVLLM